MLNHGNTYCMEYAVKNLPSDSPIIEIGSFCGLSTNIISFFLRKYSKRNKLITSDKWIFEGAEAGIGFLDGCSINHARYREFIKETYIRNIQFFSKDNLPYTIEQFSDDFFSLWSQNKLETDVMGRPVQLGGKISFSYIDGNHTYEYARRDFENSDAFLETGGFILFDDSADSTEWEVKKVMQDVRNTGRYELVIKNPNYMFRKIKQ